MCGLLGILTALGDASRFADPVAAALPCMRHRGPDDSGTWHDDDVVFGFNRLSIIDLEHSHQPLQWGPAGQPDRYALTFNGEIYNYVELREELQAQGYEFATGGDSETIVVGYHHWGADVVNHLRGMFAFAVWDTVDRKVFLARDPFGIKPMFYATTDAGTVFGSEKKCILAMADAIGLDKSLDDRAIVHYTDLQYVPEPETLHRGIRRLESGCHATLTPGGEVNAVRYFTPDFTPVPVPAGGEDALFRRIADAMEDSVAKHMRADVTVGSFLSGGIDSTAIAALAKRHNPDLVTFTTGFEREGYSEVDVAAESAEAIGVEHVVKVVSPEEFAAAVPKIIWYLDDPVADPALVPLYFVAAAARERVKVVLSGEGADELFGGYTIYKEPLSLAPFDKVPSPLKKVLHKFGELLPEGQRGKSLLLRGTTPMEQRYYGNARSFNYEQLERVLRIARPEWDHSDVTAPIYAASRDFDPRRPNAAPGPVHLDARRHPRQGGQDHHGELTRAAGAVPRQGRLRRRPDHPLRPQDQPRDHEVRSAPGHGAHRPAARHQPEEARIPGADPPLAGRPRALRLGPQDHRGLADRRDLQPGRGARHARRTPGLDDLRTRPRPLPPAVDRHRLHDLARHLRRGPHPPGDRRAGLPGLTLTGAPRRQTDPVKD